MILRGAFFQDGIEATGFVYGRPVLLEIQEDQERNRFFSDFVNRIRYRLARNVDAAFQEIGSGKNSAIANAVLVGEKSAISAETRDELAKAGLAHLLAISGLHMAFMVGAIIFSVRALLASVSSLALTAPVRKISVICGLGTGLIYFLLSGGSVSATRAFLMVSIMAGAMLLGARALSVRNLALAAFVILLLSPVELTKPGFQMSFAATLALVAIAPRWFSSFHQNQSNQTGITNILRSAGRYFIGIAITSLVAGLATGLFAAFHFYRVAPFGLISNLLAVPLFTSIVMPSGLLGLSLMSFDLEGVPFSLMNFGLDFILQVAVITNSISDYTGTTGQLNLPVFLVSSLCLVLFCVFRTSIRLLLLPVFLVLLFFLPLSRTPDVLISEDGKTLGVRLTDSTEKETLIVSGRKSGRFEVKVWKEALSIDEQTKQQDGITFACDSYGCIWQTDYGLISHVLHPAGFYEDCRRVILLISELSAPQYCREMTMVVDRSSLRQNGAHAIYF